MLLFLCCPIYLVFIMFIAMFIDKDNVRMWELRQIITWINIRLWNFLRIAAPG